jgi:hypothetical protein
MSKKKITKTDETAVVPSANTVMGITSEELVMGFDMSKVKFKIVKGTDLTDAENRDVKELVLKNGTVKPESIDDRINNAELLVLAKEDGKVQGVAALRKQKSSYMQKLIGRAKVTGLPHDSLEFCWVRLRPSRMNKGIEKEMFKRVLDAIAATPAEGETNAFAGLKDKKIFSVWRTDDIAMMELMPMIGFTKHDRDHEALVGEGKRVQLWLLS